MPLSKQDDFLGAISRRDEAGFAEARFRVWAPDAKHVEVVFETDTQRSSARHERNLQPAQSARRRHAADARHPALVLQRDATGYFSGAVRTDATLYKYRVDGEGPWPDPCSRFQPQGVHGPSQILEADDFEWSDGDWPGRAMHGQVLYELHLGTFTPAGTFDAAIGKLAHLRDLGVTTIELMPVVQCPGRWNWGYDGVQLYAPNHVYGEPAAFKRFVDRAHAMGLAVILDVVYNHLGPDGNYLKCFSPYYFSSRYTTDWGEALNFDGEQAQGTRAFVLNNVRYWLQEFHLDGLRLDATQSIFDSSTPHILSEIAQTARTAARPREVVVIAEDEAQRSIQVIPLEQGGYGLDASWNDDFHHAARVALTGSREGYYRDYTGRAQELVSCVLRGFLYQGQWYPWQQRARGTPLPLSRVAACIVYLQNHDQVGNTYIGERLHGIAAPARYRAMLALTLLAPQTPLLFMGQEFAASTPFMFFADHNPELRAQVLVGRRKFVAQFPAYSAEAAQASLVDPGDEAAYAGSKLDWSEVQRHATALALHRDLLKLRAEDPVISRQDVRQLEGATLSEHALALRWHDGERGDRLLIVNLADDLPAASLAEPLLAPPAGAGWALTWASEEPRYGGHGALSPCESGGRGPWHIAAHSAVLLRAVPE